MILIAAGAALISAPVSGLGQDVYPNRPIRLIVPFAEADASGLVSRRPVRGKDAQAAGFHSMAMTTPPYPIKPIRLIVPFAEADASGLVSRRPVRGQVAQAAGFHSIAMMTPPYPIKPIRLIVPFAPGGGTDIAARAIAQKLSAALGQQVIVDNRPGAGTVIGTEIAAKSSPDGYTLVQCSTSLSINPSLRSRLPYDALRDFATITQVVSEPYVLVTQPAFTAQSVKELLALAKAKPGQLTFGSPGTGTGGHFAGELFKLLSGTDLTHIPYKGNGPALTDLLGGQINLIFATILPALPHVKSGRLRAIAVSRMRRSALLSDVPTIAESGVPGYEAGSWNGLLAPAGTPNEIVARLNRESVRILHSPEMRERFAHEGAEAVGNSPAEFTAFIKSEMAKWAKVVKAAGIKAD